MGNSRSNDDAANFWARYEQLAPRDVAVCEDTGIAKGTLSGWKKLSRFPPADRACLIAEAIGTTVEYLVTGQDGSDPWLREHASFLADCRELDPDQFDGVAILARGYAEKARKAKAANAIA